MIGSFYTFMGRCPYPFAVIIPTVLLALLIVGFTQEDIIEKDINNIWTSTTGQFYNDINYMKSIVTKDTAGRQDLTTFSAMAVSRDEGNLFTADRLDEINERMKDLADVTVSY